MERTGQSSIHARPRARHRCVPDWIGGDGFADRAAFAGSFTIIAPAHETDEFLVVFLGHKCMHIFALKRARARARI